MPTLALVVRADNPWRYIARAIESSEGVDQIVLVSDDVAHVTQLQTQFPTATVVACEHTPLDAPPRVAIDAVNCEWLMWLRHDERLTEGAIDTLRGLLAMTAPEYSAWSIPFRDDAANNSAEPRLLRTSHIIGQPEGAQLQLRGETSPLPQSLGVHIGSQRSSYVSQLLARANDASSTDADALVDAGQYVAVVRGFRNGIDAFREHFTSQNPDAATFAEAFAAFCEKVAVHLKALEAIGWDDDALLPAPSSFHTAYEAFFSSIAESETARIRSHVARSQQLGASPRDCAIALEMLTEFYGPDADTLCDLACRYFDAGDLRGAVDTVRQGLDIAPNHAGLHGVLRDIDYVLNEQLTPEDDYTPTVLPSWMQVKVRNDARKEAESERRIGARTTPLAQHGLHDNATAHSADTRHLPS